MRRHQINMERTLLEVRSGKNVDHLCPEALVQLTIDVGKRLAAIYEELVRASDS